MITTIFVGVMVTQRGDSGFQVTGLMEGFSWV